MARKRISIEQLDDFSVEEETNKIYWRGRAVVTVMSLPWWVQFSALVASAATAVSAVAAVLALLK